MTNSARGHPVDVSVVCPFFNERQIIREATSRLLDRLASLDRSWELILVDDGSTDGSGEVVRELATQRPELRVVEYGVNRGRGHALRTGIAAARGEIIVTTEVDLSWGEEIVRQLVEALEGWPDADVVVASPNLPGGGYRNVPRRRVWISRLGNRVIRAFMAHAATMNTGMTRAYRAAVIKSLPLHEDGKEFHLEVMLKATTLGYRIREIPAVLEWRDYRQRGARVERKSSSKVNKLIVSHSLFSIFANPIRYVWALSAVSLLLGLLWLGWAIWLLMQGQVSAFAALVSILLVVISIVLFVLGVVLHQGHMIQRELWLLQRGEQSRNRQA